MKIKQNTFIVTLLFLITLTLLSACSSIDVTTTYEPDADYNKLRSFMVVENQQEEIIYLPMDKDVFEKTLRDSFATELTSKGFNTTPNNPDFLVSYYVVVRELREQLRIDKYYIDQGYHPTLRTHIRAYPVGSLIVDIIDTSSKKSIWRGTAKSILGEHDNESDKIEKIRLAVHKLLASFPPK